MKDFNLFLKGIKPALILFLFPACLALILSSCANQKSGDDGTYTPINITLYVDTDSINNNTSIDKFIRITDGAGSSSGRGVKKHTTYIDSAQEIFWRVKTEPWSRKKVEITKITNEHGSFNLIDSLKFMPNKSFVKGWVKHKYVSGEDKYNIHFKVNEEQGDPLDFVVDPILRMVRE